MHTRLCIGVVLRSPYPKELIVDMTGTNDRGFALQTSLSDYDILTLVLVSSVQDFRLDRLAGTARPEVLVSRNSFSRCYLPRAADGSHSISHCISAGTGGCFGGFAGRLCYELLILAHMAC